MATGRMIINILSPKVFIYLNDDALLLWLLYERKKGSERKKQKWNNSTDVYTSCMI